MLRKDFQDLDENGQRGDWFFEREDKYIVIRFGLDAFEDVCVLPLNGAQKVSWKWNGDREKPTLSPSILIYGRDNKSHRWHGFLENGILRDA